MKIKYLAHLIVLVVIIAAVVLLGNSTASSLQFAPVIFQCPQADYGTDGLVKNGHSTDQQDLYSRHQECFQGILEANFTDVPSVTVTTTPVPENVPAVVYPTLTKNPPHSVPTSVVVVSTKVPPTKKPLETPGIHPTKVPPTDEPEKVCKNKNSGKDGTPLECNAGGGQEK